MPAAGRRWSPDEYPWPISNALRFLSETVWEEELGSLLQPRQLFFAVCRVIYLLGRAFVTTRVQLQAAALTYTTVLALVPTFAVIVAVFQPYSGLKDAEGQIKSLLFESIAPAWQADAESYLNQFVDNVHGGAGGLMTGLAVCFLFYSVITLLSTIEHTLNEVWGVKRSRNMVRRFTVYWSVATLGPILVGVALTLSEDFVGKIRGFSVSEWWARSGQSEKIGDGTARGYLAGGLTGASTASRIETVELPIEEPDPPAAPAAPEKLEERSGALPHATAVILVMIAFTVLYAFMPNTHVRLVPAIIGALIAAILWDLSKTAFTESSTRLIRENKIYGSLAALPLTMFWIYISWNLVIVGAEISHAIQNLRTHRREEQAPQTTQRLKEELALRIVLSVANQFARGSTPPNPEQLAEELGAPVGLVGEVCEHLVIEEFLREAGLSEDELQYVPARPLTSISMDEIITSMHEKAGVSYPLRDGPGAEIVRERMKEAAAAARTVTGSFSFAALAEQAGVDAASAALGEKAPPVPSGRLTISPEAPTEPAIGSEPPTEPEQEPEPDATSETEPESETKPESKAEPEPEPDTTKPASDRPDDDDR